MTAVEQVEAVLEAHRFVKVGAMCACGDELGERGHRIRAWRRHVAQVLDAAGLLADPPIQSDNLKEQT